MSFMERERSTISLLSKRKKLARITFIDDSLKRTLLLFKKDKTNTKERSHSLFEDSILNFKYDQILNHEKLDQNKLNFEVFHSTELQIATNQLKLEEKYRIKALEDAQIKEAERKGMIKLIPAAAYLKVLDRNRQKSAREEGIKGNISLKSIETTTSREIDVFQRLNKSEDKSISEAKKNAFEEFFRMQELEKMHQKHAEESRKKTNVLKKKQNEESSKLRALLEAEKEVEEERLRLKAIDDANRLKILEDKAKHRAIRASKVKAVEEAKLKEEKLIQIKENEAARMREEKMLKIREEETIKQKKIEENTKLKLLEAKIKQDDGKAIERKSSLRLKSKLEVIMDKTMFKEDLRAVRELEKKELELKARKVAEEKAKRDIQMSNKHINYNIDFLKDRLKIQERRFLEEKEKLDAINHARKMARENERIEAESMTRQKAESESQMLVEISAQLKAEEEYRRKKALEEEVATKIKVDKMKIVNSSRYLLKDIEHESKKRAIEEMEKRLKQQPDIKLAHVHQKVIDDAKAKLTKDSDSKKVTKTKKKTSRAEHRVTELKKPHDTTKIKAALSYLASIEDFLLEQKAENPADKYGFTEDYLKEKRKSKESKEIVKKLNISELKEAKKRSEIRARKRFEAEIRKQTENGTDIFDYFQMEDFFDDF